MTAGRKSRQRRQDQRPAGARFTITAPGATIPASPFPALAHPGNDKILVSWPDVPPGLDNAALGEWLAASHPPDSVRTIVDEVTRDEFIRRLAGLGIVSQVNANPRVRVAALVEPQRSCGGQRARHSRQRRPPRPSSRVTRSPGR
jgi:hypothetical protein